MMPLLESNINKIAELCKKYKVKELYVFGSILTPRFTPESDIDLVAEFDRTGVDPENMADIFFGFIDDMEQLFKRKIDLTEYSAIKNRFFKQEVDNTRQLLWTA